MRWFQNLWSPIYDVAAILTSIQSLLDEPNVTSPANVVAAELYQKDRREYQKRIQRIVEKSWVDDVESDVESEEEDDDEVSSSHG